MTDKKKIINLIRSELVVGKNKQNDYSKNHFDYRSADDIYKALKPLLLKYDAMFSVTAKPEGLLGRDMMHAVAKYSDGEVEFESDGYAEIAMQKGMTPAQCIGSATSYAIKYAMQAMFMLDDSKDQDSLDPNESQPYAQSRPQQQVQNQQALEEARWRVQNQAANTKVGDTNLLALYRDAQQQGKGSVPSQVLGKWANENGKDGLDLINAIHDTQAWV